MTGPRAPALLLGVGLGGFIDGIIGLETARRARAEGADVIVTARKAPGARGARAGRG